MERIKRFKWSILIIIIHLIIVLYFNVILSSDVLIPRQWDYKGDIAYSGKGFGLWFLLNLNAFLVLAFVLFPLYSPRYRRNPGRFDSILPNLTFIVSFFLMIIHLYMLLWAIDFQYLKGENVIFVLIGLLFIFLGNILPKIPSNFFAGVRTPWTLTSEKNWHKTHRVSGFAFVIGGILMIIRGFIHFTSTLSLIHTFGVLGFLLFYPIIYSYTVFLQEKKEKRGGEK
ncbi:MAG: SdpI family protein [Candidatus Cloacimonetes bacterium]|nr:SdpI family protein [Candidatus Cloacimonadota bacterium]